MIDNVFRFNRDVIGIRPRRQARLDGDEREWMLKALSEEVIEFEDAINIVDQVDALLDLVIFALGGLYRMGLTEEQARQCFEHIMMKNYQKKAGQKAERATGDVADAVKPEGWVGPEAGLAKILGVTIMGANNG